MSRRFGQAVGGRGGQAIAESGASPSFASSRSSPSSTRGSGVGRTDLPRPGVRDRRGTHHRGSRGRPALPLPQGQGGGQGPGPDGHQVLIDELGPGEMLGWGAVMEPHVYTASAWTTEPSKLIVVDGKDLRELCEANKHIGYQVAKGVGEVISRRFGQVVARTRRARPSEAYGIDELHQFKIFAELDVADLESVARISHVQEFESRRGADHRRRGGRAALSLPQGQGGGQGALSRRPARCSSTSSARGRCSAGERSWSPTSTPPPPGRPSHRS